MSFPSTTTEIDAVNNILAAIGQAPVSSIDQTNPDVSIAYRTLLSVSKTVQSEGWTFNTEYDVPFHPDASTKKISVAANILSIDLMDEFRDQDIVNKNGFLYDRIKRTDEFDDVVKCEVTYEHDFDNLPEPAKSYITARAATISSQRMIGDSNLYQLLKDEEGFTRAQLLEYECNSGDYTYFGKPKGANRYISFKPYKALER